MLGPMQLIDGSPVYSATDLVGYLECEHLTELERAALAGLVARPERADPELDVLRERGMEHERRYRAHLESRGRGVVDGRDDKHEGLPRGAQLRADAALTLGRMREGHDVIYQATFFDGTWLGYADFLLRVDGASTLGDYHYEIADTKLARRTKAGALLQMCVYADLLAPLQGRLPEHVHVALGGSGHHIDTHRLADYFAYYRAVKGRFEAAMMRGTPTAYPLASTPPPVTHCGVCRWQADCAARRRRDDHLSLVAGMRSDQVRRLTDAGISTTTALGHLRVPLPHIRDLSDTSFAALQEQARLQVISRDQPTPAFELMPIEAKRGLASLPPPSFGDLFFDMEGDPFAEEDGLEYLFGVIDPLQHSASGEPCFHAWWAHSPAEERIAFEQFIDFVMDRWRRDPAMHVFHYAAYERGRLGMLSTRHATREREVDDLLRGDVLVDLYRVVRQGVRIGTESYSIKKLEPLYALHRKAALKDAGSSVVAYEQYIHSIAADEADQSILDGIARYNEDDCLSNLALRDWLEERRAEIEAAGVSVPRPEPSEIDPGRVPNDRDLRIEALVERLTGGIPEDPAARAADPERQARWLLAELLEWHRREENAEWWEFFRLCELTDADLVREDSAIGELTYVGSQGEIKQSIVHRYRFDPGQEHRMKVGDEPVDPRTQSKAGPIHAIDDANGTIDLLRGRKSSKPHPTSLIPAEPLVARAQKEAMERIGTWVADHDIAGPGPYRAARDLLRRAAPRTGQAPGAPLAQPDERPLDAAVRIGSALDASYLPVQGPPGSGKTYTGAEMVLEQIRRGRRVGITAFTHKAIVNLLDEILAHAARTGVQLRVIRKLERDEDPQGKPYRCTGRAETVADALALGEVQLAAGTSWMWAREELDGLVDTLFVDEAGQMSLANVVAISGAARNLILLGDPQQLSQVKKGAHPDGAGASSLEHVLAGQPVIDPAMGLLLAVTWRLHPDLCRFTSEAFYAGELRSEPSTSRQSVDAPGVLTGTGVRWVALPHLGNRNASIPEVARVVELYGDLLRGRWTNQHGSTVALTPRDILVLAPYNAHVELLTKALPPSARVGTVDKFQGQEAAVVLYSMATSTPDEMPRSMEFLYSLNRLNVATSRARCLAAVIASPALLLVRCHTPLQMRLANAMCRFVEIAAVQQLDAQPLAATWSA